MRWIDGAGMLRTTLLRDGRQVRYVAHLSRLLDGQTLPYPEPVLEWRTVENPYESESILSRHLYVHWSDGDESRFFEGSEPLEYVMRLQEILAMPERERWLHLNVGAALSLDEGLRQSARGEVRSLGSFAQYERED